MTGGSVELAESGLLSEETGLKYAAAARSATIEVKRRIMPDFAAGRRVPTSREGEEVPAYVVVDVEIEDPVIYREYMKLTPAAIAAYGGRFVVRGGTTETLEGDWQPGRFVILEFESLERAREWWSSPEYAPAKALRQQSASTRMILAEGVPD